MKYCSLLFFLLSTLVACDGSGTSNSSRTNQAQIAVCIERGVSYFREIGSYPNLSSAPNAGRLAEEVAAERCSRTTTAF